MCLGCVKNLHLVNRTHFGEMRTDVRSVFTTGKYELCVPFEVLLNMKTIYPSLRDCIGLAWETMTPQGPEFQVIFLTCFSFSKFLLILAAICLANNSLAWLTFAPTKPATGWAHFLPVFHSPNSC